MVCRVLTGRETAFRSDETASEECQFGGSSMPSRCPSKKRWHRTRRKSTARRERTSISDRAVRSPSIKQRRSACREQGDHGAVRDKSGLIGTSRSPARPSHPDKNARVFSLQRGSKGTDPSPKASFSDQTCCFIRLMDALGFDRGSP